MWYKIINLKQITKLGHNFKIKQETINDESLKIQSTIDITSLLSKINTETIAMVRATMVNVAGDSFYSNNDNSIIYIQSNFGYKFR